MQLGVQGWGESQAEMGRQDVALHWCQWQAGSFLTSTALGSTATCADCRQGQRTLGRCFCFTTALTVTNYNYCTGARLSRDLPKD